MANAFQSAQLLAAKTLARVAGQAITYHAGAIEIAITDAVLGSTDYEVTDENGAQLRSRQTDWLIMVSRLVSGGNAIEPQPGHRIVFDDGTTERKYEVQKMGDEGCFRFSGPAFDRYRIHVREIPA